MVLLAAAIHLREPVSFPGFERRSAQRLFHTGNNRRLSSFFLSLVAMVREVLQRIRAPKVTGRFRNAIDGQT